MSANAKTASQELVDQYMEESAKHPPLSREEEVRLAIAYLNNNDLNAANRLVAANLRFVVKVAHEYSGYGLDLLDLIQEGNIGLMMAVKKFDPEKGNRLISYATWWIRAYINNYVIRSWSLVKVGTTQQQRKLFFKLRQTRARVDREAGPGEHGTALQIAERLNVRESDVLEMEQRLAGHDASLNAVVNDGSSDTFLDVLEDHAENQETEQVRKSEVEHVRTAVDALRPSLSEREIFVLEHRTLSEEPMALTQLGDELRLSRERVRQIEKKLIKRIGDQLHAPVERRAA